MTEFGPRWSVAPNERVTFGVVYEDEHFIIVHKPAGVATQPGRGHASDSLLSGLFARYAAQLQNLGKARQFGLVHRLDRETSGLLVVALTVAAYDGLRALFETRGVRKHYWAICARPPKEPTGVIKLAIAETRTGSGDRPGPVTPKQAHVAGGGRGKAAITAYRLVSASDMAALVEARPITGRLHQVRVHLTAIGCPILGDPEYGPATARGAASRLMLHAWRLAFDHPVTGEPVDARAPMPRDMKRVLRRMGIEAPAGRGPRDPETGAESDEE